MLTERNIAFFIDVYNTDLTAEHYSNIVAQLEQMGSIISGTIYGATERTHKEVLTQADLRGYSVLRASRKRGRKAFDNRIIVDVVDKVNHSVGIDTVAIVALPTDLIYLYAYLRERGIKIIALNNGEENSMALVDETVDSGKVVTLKLPKAPAQPKATPAPVVEEPVVESPAPVVEEPVVELPVQPVVDTPVEEPVVEAPAPVAVEPTVTAEVSRMDQLLKEIDRLRAEVEKTSTPTTEVPVAPVEEPVVEAPAVEDPVVETPAEPQVETPVEEPVVEPSVEPAQVEEPADQTAQPATAYAGQESADLLRKIEEMRKTVGSTDDLIDEIKKLLDDID